MSKKTLNKRCPLQAECDRKCEYAGRELNCDYYKNNGIGDKVIADQEELRRMLERQRELAVDAAEVELVELQENALVYISVDELYPHPDNPRKELGDLTELADSIRSKGVMQNLTVVKGHTLTGEEWSELSRKYDEDPTEVLRAQMNRRTAEEGYTVIIGHRRLSAAKLAGVTELPCVIVEMPHREQVATMLLENMQRVDLTVYEQAQGFQMMMDLGESVESISEKTGFSKTTVRRRLKMAELDRDVLKSVSGRQISLDDFDRLSQIEDLTLRNKCLSDIGTANFNQSVSQQIKKQNIAKKLPLVKEEIKRLKAKKITRSETWNGKYDNISGTQYFHEWDPETPLIEEKTVNGRKLFYYIDEDYGTLRFYVERPKAKPQKRPQAEIDREKYIADVREKLAALTADMYRLRWDFVADVKLTKQNADAMLKGAVVAGALGVLTYMSSDSTALYSVLGIDAKTYDPDRPARAISMIQNGSTLLCPTVIYAMFADKPDHGYYSKVTRMYPEYESNYKLDALYEWLTSLGYEMSDEEKQLRDGTHPLFVDKDARIGNIDPK